LAGRLAIDFGTSNTRIALWNEAAHQAELVTIPDISGIDTYINSEGSKIDVPFINSLINYSGNQVWIGRQVQEHGRVESHSTFRWMKHYVSNRLELPRNIEGKRISFPDAATDFLSLVIRYTAAHIGLGNEEVAFTVPVEAYEHYQDWLIGVCEKAGITRYRLIDEASAAALGYGVNVRANQVFMVFDFGGGTLDVSIVKMEDKPTGGKCCRVLGKGGAEIGGSTVDKWIYDDLLSKARIRPDDVRHLSTLILLEAEKAKKKLTTDDSADILIIDPDKNKIIINHRYTRTQFEDLLESHGMFSTMQGTIDVALRLASEKGYNRDRINDVLLVGGSSLIPSVRRSVRQLFCDRVKYHKPLESVVLGGAAFISDEVSIINVVKHDYALMGYDSQLQDYVYRLLVESGTVYPTDDGLCELTVKAALDNEEFLGIDIYEVGSQGRESGESDEKKCLELVWDHSGNGRLIEKRQEPREGNYWRYKKVNSKGEKVVYLSETKPSASKDIFDISRVRVSSMFHINEKNRTFIHAQPPAKKDDPRFPVSFSIDNNKRLCLTVRDIISGKPLFKDYPIVKLT
jgi:molecular chaperone DnaK